MPNRRIAMHARALARLVPERSAVDWFDASTPGLALHVSPAGSKTWYLFYRHLRTTRRVKLGTYPAVELAKARELARAERVRVETQGADPAAERKQARAADSIADLCREYLTRHAKARKRSWKEDERIINAEILPAWQHRAIVDIRRRDALALVQKVADRGAGIMANRVCALLSRMFRFAVDHELIDANPAAQLPRPTREQSRDRVLTPDEIRGAWRAWEALSPVLAAYWKVRVLTAQRGGEVAGMEWADVDLADGWWTIPAHKAKNGLTHRVPLTAQVLDLLRARRAAHDAILTAREKRRREAAPLLFVFDGVRGKKQRQGIETGIPDFRGHDLRRTAASLMTAGGVSRATVAKLLNHVEPGVTKVYDRYSYDNEKRAALTWWDARLAAIVNGDGAEG